MTVEDEDGRTVQRHQWSKLELAVIGAVLALLAAVVVSLVGGGLLMWRGLAVVETRLQTVEDGQNVLKTRTADRYTEDESNEDWRLQHALNESLRLMIQSNDARIDKLDQIVVRLDTLILSRGGLVVPGGGGGD